LQPTAAATIASRRCWNPDVSRE